MATYDLLKDITINCRIYRPNAGWNISSDIPNEFLNKTATATIEGFTFNEHKKVIPFVHSFDVRLDFFLDNIISQIVKEIRKLRKTDPKGVYFEDHCFLEELIFDPKTMKLEVAFGS